MKHSYLFLFFIIILSSSCSKDDGPTLTSPRLTQIELIDPQLDNSFTINYSYHPSNEISQVVLASDGEVFRRFEYDLSNDGQVNSLTEFSLRLGSLVEVYESKFEYQDNIVFVTKTGDPFLTDGTSVTTAYVFEEDRLVSINDRIHYRYDEGALIQKGIMMVRTSDIDNPLFSLNRIFAPEFELDNKFDLLLDPISENLITETSTDFEEREIPYYSIEVTSVSEDNLPLGITNYSKEYLFTYE